MAHRIDWTGPALDDLRGILEDLSRTSEDAARRLGETILSDVEVLSRFPHIGPVYPRDRRGRIREILCGTHRIFYRVHEDQERVEILALWHTSRRDPNPARLLDRTD